MKKNIFIIFLMSFAILANATTLFTGPVGIALKNNDGVTTEDLAPFIQLQKVVELTSPTIGTLYPFEFEVTGDDLQSWVTQGTDGLQLGGQKSVLFAVFANPKNNNGIVVGWKTIESGSGSIEVAKNGNTATITARLDYGNKTQNDLGAFTTETLAIGYFDDVRVGLAQYADLLVDTYDINLKPQPVLYCSWYDTWDASSPAKIRQNAKYAAKHLKPWGFNVIQLDDKWQAGNSKGNGPNKNFNKVHPVGRYAISGMQKTADDIKGNGFTAGIWFMPFSGSYNDPFYKDKQDFFVRRANGQPYDTFWGGTCFDMTNPKVEDYVRQMVSRIYNEWGYEYFKIDGLWTGLGCDMLYINKGFKDTDNIDDSFFSSSEVSNVEAYRKGLKIVNETTDNNAFVLGCNLAQNMRVLGASIGMVDGMRIGADNNYHWSGDGDLNMKVGPESTSSLYFLNKKVWYNDPDPTYVRTAAPYKHSRTLTSFVGFTGSLHTTSVKYSTLPKKRLELIQKTIPTHDELAVPVDYLKNRIIKTWVIDSKATENRGAIKLAGIFNWDDNEMNEWLDLKELNIESNDIVAFDYWDEDLIDADELVNGKFKVDVDGRDCQIVAFKELSDTPQVIATNRHIGCGLVDLLSEKATASSMQVTVNVPPTPDYKLFIVPAKGQTFTRVPTVKITAGMGVIKDVDLEEDNGLLEIELSSSALNEISLDIQF